jgi:hypothetical protein
MKLLDLRARDGSRQFLALAEVVPWGRLRAHLGNLAGAKETGYLSDEVTEVWIDFQYRGHAFSVNNPCGEYWFFVRDPACPGSVLESVAQHCAWLFTADDTPSAQ